MDITVNIFINTNNQKSDLKWIIDGNVFTHHYYIPQYLLEKFVCSWSVDLTEGIIEIETSYN